MIDPTRPSWGESAEEDVTARLLRVGAPACGLGVPLAFAKGRSLSDRLAHNPFLLAPMAGVTDASYRLMARAGGAGLAYSEMVSVAGLHYTSSKTWELAMPHAAEPDLAVQLFGSDPAQFAEAAAAVQERLGERLALIDINMACPVPKVVRKGEGSALLDDPLRAAAIVSACVESCRVPVSVKLRRSRRANDLEVAPSFARAMEAAGASAVAVHGRSASQLYRGEADWGVVARTAAAVDVPVIGSGDVRSAGDAARMLDETGCAAVMIARGSYGNPWLAGDALALRAHTEPKAHGLVERLAAFCLHVRLLEATGAHLARARSLSGWYLRGAEHAARWRARAMQCSSVSDYLSLAEELACRAGVELPVACVGDTSEGR